MKTRILLTSISALAATVALGSHAFAQTLDYDAMSGLFGEPVTAGATGAPQRASDVPATMIIITRADIDRFPERDIPGILRHFSGIDVDRFTYGQGEVSIRGYNQPMAPRLLVLINGRQVYLDHYGFTSWGSLPVQLDEIQQIEVVKGPQSALYGFNAVSGVVNIITRNPQQGEYLAGRVATGDAGYVEGNAAGGFRLSDSIALRASIGAARADQFDVGPYGAIPGATTDEIQIPNIDFDRLTAAVELYARAGTSTNISVEGTYSHLVQPEFYPLWFGGRADTITSSFKAELTSDTDYGIVTARGYRNNLDVDYSTDSALAADVPFSNEVTVLQLQNIFKIGTQNTFRLGFEWRENGMESTPVTTNGDVSYTVTSFSAMWNRTLNRAWSFTVAARHDTLELQRSQDPDPFFLFSRADFDRSIEELSYNAALSWKPGPGSTVRLSTGRGVQAPSLVEFGFTLTSAIPTPFGPLPAAFVGNPAIEPTIIRSHELAYDRALTSGVNFRGAVFLIETEAIKGFFGAMPDLTPGPAYPGFAFLFSNQGDSELMGAEFTVSGESGPWDWGVTATFLDVEDALTVNQIGFTHPIDFENSTPRQRFNARIGWTGEDWSVEAFANHVSSTEQPREFAFGVPSRERVDSHNALSFRMNRTITDNIGVSLNAQNITYGNGERVTSGPGIEARYWLTLRASR